MKLIALNCQQCGAPLEVPTEVKHVSCAHCGSALVVKKQGTERLTAEVAATEQPTDPAPADPQQMRTKQALQRLQRQWESERRELSVFAVDNLVVIPTRLLGCVVGLLLMGVAFPLGYFTQPLLGIVLAVVAFGIGSHICSQADLYDRALNVYLETRNDLRQRIR